MYIDPSLKLDFDSVLIRPKRSTLLSRKDVSLKRTFKTLHSRSTLSCVPIIASNMATGTFEMAEVFRKNNMLVSIAKHNNHKWEELLGNGGQQSKAWNDKLEMAVETCFYTIGMSDDELNALEKFANKILVKRDLKICVDIANGYSQTFADFIREVRRRFKENVIMAGNVCTPEMTQELIMAGADIIKIGISPGSVCTTRKKTGVGYPQISAAMENADVAHGLNALICLDGGMRVPGDVAKAFGANADFVMLGGMLAGTDECEGEIITKYFRTDEVYWENGGWAHTAPIEKKFKIFYGMSSEISPLNIGKNKSYATSEGAVEEVDYKGPVQPIINDILGGLRSACTYIGASELKHFGKCCSFIRVNRQHDKF